MSKTGQLVVAVIAVVVMLPVDAAAVGGISGAKLATPNTATVPDGHMEFEPYLGIEYQKLAFDEDWSRFDLDGTYRTVETGFRFTLGLAETVELGLVAPVVFARAWIDGGERFSSAGLGDIPLGLKWAFLRGDEGGLALQLGVTLPTGDYDPGPEELPLGDGAVTPELGLIATVEDPEGLSFDVSLAGGLAIPVEEGDYEWLAALDLGLGYMIGSFQPVVELNQSLGGTDGADSYLLSTNVGFTFELSPEVIVVAGARIDLVGRNTPLGYAGNLAFTLLL
jgi:hypothetical protein